MRWKILGAEAIQLAAVLQKVSGATEDGRNTTKKAADDAERLARAQRDLAFAESENAKKLTELKLAQQEANQINKLIVKINQSAEGSYNRLSAQYSLNKIYLNNMTKSRTGKHRGGAKSGCTNQKKYTKKWNVCRKQPGNFNWTSEIIRRRPTQLLRMATN